MALRKHYTHKAWVCASVQRAFNENENENTTYGTLERRSQMDIIDTIKELEKIYGTLGLCALMRVVNAGLENIHKDYEHDSLALAVGKDFSQQGQIVVDKH